MKSDVGRPGYAVAFAANDSQIIQPFFLISSKPCPKAYPMALVFHYFPALSNRKICFGIVSNFSSLAQIPICSERGLIYKLCALSGQIGRAHV